MGGEVHKAPVIPNSVTDMSCTFYNCFALTGTIEVNANPDSSVYCLVETKVSDIYGACSQETKDALKATK